MTISPPPAGQTILIVDDELSSQVLLTTILQVDGYSILVAENGEMTLDLLKKNHIDMVLLDIILSGIDGYHICKKLKTHKAHQDIPVIFITSLDQDIDEERGLAAGAVDFLKKPINPAILRARVATHLELKKQRELLETQKYQLSLKTDSYEREVARRVKVEEDLVLAQIDLERRVKERTEELRKTNRAMAEEIMKRKRSEKKLQKNEIYLAKQNAKLEEINVALKVLLEKRDRDKREYEEHIVSQVKQLIDPYISMLLHSPLSERQKSQLDALAANFKEILSPFTHNMFSLKLQLTPVEIQIANLVKQGKSSKEIAELLSITQGTVDLHRKNIRKKCGLSHQKINLRNYLLSLQI